MWNSLLSVASISFLLSSSLVAAADSDPSPSNGLPPWAVGLVAVAGFLVVAFLMILLNTYWCQQFYERDDEDEDMAMMDNGVSNGAFQQDVVTEL